MNNRELTAAELHEREEVVKRIADYVVSMLSQQKTILVVCFDQMIALNVKGHIEWHPYADYATIISSRKEYNELGVLTCEYEEAVLCQWGRQTTTAPETEVLLFQIGHMLEKSEGRVYHLKADERNVLTEVEYIR